MLQFVKNDCLITIVTSLVLRCFIKNTAGFRVMSSSLVYHFYMSFALIVIESQNLIICSNLLNFHIGTREWYPGSESSFILHRSYKSCQTSSSFRPTVIVKEQLQMSLNRSLTQHFHINSRSQGKKNRAKYRAQGTKKLEAVSQYSFLFPEKIANLYLNLTCKPLETLRSILYHNSKVSKSTDVHTVS